MKIISLHCDFIKFKPLKKALKQPEELSEKRLLGEEVKDPLVILTAVEKQDEVNEKIVEKLIQEATDKITKHQTSIIIAHRLTTVKKADRIIVMDKGKIMEQGSHNELLKLNGYYKSLYELQFADKVA